jgi:hypothetical protein
VAFEVALLCHLPLPLDCNWPMYNHASCLFNDYPQSSLCYLPIYHQETFHTLLHTVESWGMHEGQYAGWNEGSEWLHMCVWNRCSINLNIRPLGYIFPRSESPAKIRNKTLSIPKPVPTGSMVQSESQCCHPGPLASQDIVWTSASVNSWHCWLFLWYDPADETSPDNLIITYLGWAHAPVNV